MLDNSLPLLLPPTQQIGKLDSTLPAVNVPHKGFMDAVGQLFGDTAGSMWQATTQGQGGKGQAGNAMGVPEDADEAMQQAMQVMSQARSKSASGGAGGNGESAGNSIGDTMKFITQLFGG